MLPIRFQRLDLWFCTPTRDHRVCSRSELGRPTLAGVCRRRTRAGGAAACRGERAQRAGSSAAASRLMAAGLVAAGFLGPPASPITPLCLASARCRVASATTAHLKARRSRRCRPLVNSLSLPTLCAAGPRPPDRGRARGMSRRCEPSWSSWARTPLESQHPTGQRLSPVWKMRWTACCPTM